MCYAVAPSGEQEQLALRAITAVATLLYLVAYADRVHRHVLTRLCSLLSLQTIASTLQLVFICHPRLRLSRYYTSFAALGWVVLVEAMPLPYRSSAVGTCKSIDALHLFLAAEALRNIILHCESLRMSSRGGCSRALAWCFRSGDVVLVARFLAIVGVLHRGGKYRWVGSPLCVLGPRRDQRTKPRARASTRLFCTILTPSGTTANDRLT